MKLRYFLSLIIALIISRDTFCSEIKGIRKHNKVQIEGVFNAMKLTRYPQFESEIVIYASTFPGSYIDIRRIKDHLFYKVRCKIGEKFKIEIPCKSSFLYLNIAYTLPSQIGVPEPFFSDDNFFIVKNGDKLNLAITNNFITFNGAGSKKYQCQSDIYIRREKMEDALVNFNKNDYNTFMHKYMEIANSTLRERLNVLDRYKKYMDSQFYEILLLHCYTLKYNGFYGNLYSSAVLNLNFYKYLKNNRISFKESDAIKGFPETIKEISPQYTSSIIMKMKLELFLNSIDSIPRKATYKDLNQKIIENYDGVIKDMLITFSFFQLLDNSSKPAIAYIDKAINQVKDLRYKSILLDLKKYQSSGANLSKYYFKNRDNKDVSLSEFKDNVVILDFWYTGCENCIILNEKMEPVVKKYIHNPIVKFISVSIDVDRNRWYRSLKGGKYTSEISVNLYTNGLGVNHPVIKDFNIIGYPAMYIIKKNKIVSSNPPSPFRKASTDELTNLIDSLVRQKE